MNIREIVLNSAVLFQGKSLEEREFKLNCFLLLTEEGRNKDSPWEPFEILALVEDLAGFRSDEEIWQVLDELKILEKQGDGYLLRPSLFFEELTQIEPDRKRKSIDTSYIDQLDEQLQQSETSGYFSCRYVIDDSYRLMKNLADRIAKSGLTLPPMFWNIDQEQNLSPMGKVLSSTAALDTFLLLFLPLYYRAGLERREKQSSLDKAEKLLENILIFRQGRNTDFPGTLRVPEDDDYPGYDKPTVPSNALLLYNTLLFHELKPDSPLLPSLKDFADPLVSYLLAMQLPSGAWGAGLDWKPSATMTELAVKAMDGAYGLLDRETQDKVIQAFKRCRDFLLEVKGEQGEEAFWCCRLKKEGEKEAVDSMLCLLTLHRIHRRSPGNSLDGLDEKVFNFIESSWKISSRLEDMVYKEPIKSPPRPDSPPISIEWEQPGHCKIATALFDLYLEFNLTIPRSIFCKIDSIISIIVATSKPGGYWTDFYLSDKMIPTNTRFNVETIAKYLTASRKMGNG